jgi:hypothetical protein
VPRRDSKGNEIRGNGRTKATPARAEWQGFVRCELNDLQREDLKANPFTMVELAEWLGTCAEWGCKFSYTYDDSGNVHIVSMTVRAADSVNAGLTLTGRGSSFTNALSSLCYKETVILKDTPWRQFAAERPTEEYG